jgi:uncharacterized protein YgiB involved in biofilm formation
MIKKRVSNHVYTKLVGSLGLSALFVLTGCDDKVTTHAYKTEKECIDANIYDDNFCRKSFDDAKKHHEKYAPKYENIKDCEKQFGEGECSQASNDTTQSHSSFTPFMMGYMMGGSGAGHSNVSSPVYSSPSRGFVSVSGNRVAPQAFSPKGTTTPRSSFASVSSRGGFGSSGRSISIGG